MDSAFWQLKSFITQIASAWSANDGNELAHLLQITSENSYCETVAMGLASLTERERLSILSKSERQALGEVEGRKGLVEMILPHMQSMEAFYQSRYVSSYSELIQSAQIFLQESRLWESTWYMPVLYGIVIDLRNVATLADAALDVEGKTGNKLSGVGAFLMKAFGNLAGNPKKRMFALHIACTMFKIYEQLGTSDLSKPVIRVIEASSNFSEYPASDRVTYKYYTSRMDVFNDNYAEAEVKLTYALEHCHHSAVRNIRKILLYLIPIKLYQGFIPKDDLINLFSFPEYSDIITSLKKGDMNLYKKCMEENEEKFLQLGVYFILEKLQPLILRRLLKKMYIIQKQKDESKAHQIKIDSILKIFEWQNMDCDSDEAECIIANLIHQGFVKGYFSFQSKVLVLSKTEPFPPLSRRILNNV